LHNQGHMAVFDPNDLGLALRSGTYSCSINLWWLNAFWSATPNVPLNQTNMERARTFYFSEPPSRFPFEVVVAAADGMEHHKGAWKRISPCEIVDALVLQVAYRITHGASEDELARWKAVITTVPA